MPDQVTTGTALYYPHLQVGSGELKSWLLYWDRVRRIVPGGYEWALRDDEEGAMAAKEGYLLNTPPDAYRDEAAKLFRSKVLPLLTRKPPKNDPIAHYLAELKKETTARPFEIMIEKMSDDLAEELQKRRLARKSDDPEWLEFNDLTGGMYMACLGATMGEAIKAPLVTDNPKFSPSGDYLLFASAPPVKDADADRAVLGKLGIALPTPETLVTVPMTKILAFKKQRADELARYRASVQTLLTGVAEREDPVALQDFLAAKQREIESSMKDYRWLLKELGVGAVNSVLKLTIPAGLGAVAAKVTEWADPTWMGVAGLSIGFAALWAEISGKRRKAAKENPWLYASEAQRKFG